MAGLITYYSYDLMTNTLQAELPLNAAKWSQRLNAAGSFSGTLKLSDPKVKGIGALDATRPSRSLVVIDLDGSIEFAGIIWTRKYQSSTSTLSIAGNEAYSYLTQRVQAQDYTVNPGGLFWNVDPADACLIAAQVIADAIAVGGSAFSAMTINVLESISNPNPIIVSYPLTSLQTIDSILSTLSENGYGTGFDFGLDASWSHGQGSTPVFSFNISYPRRGRVAGSTGLTLDSSSCLDYEWDEDGTQQAGTIYGVASSGGGLQEVAADPTVIAAGYPLLEVVENYSAINSASQLATAVEGDLAALEWPVATPTFTMPATGDPAVGDFIMGDDMRVIMQPDERFPLGFDTFLRITGGDYTAGDEGITNMKLTMTTIPALAPVPPPPL